ncbi:MAG: TolC family protein [Deferribacterota bacterium]|nr:TolC family protein [Deferribacterota bacterium]
MKKIIIIIILFYTPLYADKLDISELQEIVLKENPRLKSLGFEAEMLKKRIPSSGALEDPKIKFGLKNVPTSDFSFKEDGMTSKEIGVSQMFPLGGKLKINESIATKEYKLALERLRKERIDILSKLRTYVYELGYIRASIKILKEIKGYIKLLMESEKSASKSGIGSLTNVVKANIEAIQIDEELISLKQSRRELHDKINYLAGRKVNIKVGDLSNIRLTSLESKKIKENILNENPDIKILSLERNISEDEIELKKKEYYPDVVFEVSYSQREDGPNGQDRSDLVSAMVTFNIPLWQKRKNKPMVLEMERKKWMINSLIIDKKNELMAQAKTILSQLKKRRELYKLYTGQLIPQNELALQTNLAQYKTGGVEIMNLIDTIRMLLKYKREALLMQKEYMVGLSELNALMGVEVLK